MVDEIKQKNILLIPVVGQPPTYGMVMAIFAVADEYDEVILCVRDNPMIIPTNTVMMMLGYVFKKPKFIIVSHKADFADICEIPSEIIDDVTHIASLSYHVYINLTSHGYHVRLLPKPFGYNDTFMRTAYQQGFALDMLYQNSKLSDNKNKEGINHAS